jgi:guanylate kinase
VRGKILLISGPSGSGKSTLIKRLIAEFGDELYFSISSTTRDMREGETDGVNYHFISESKFRAGIDRGDFLEWANVHGKFYGTSLKVVTSELERGKTVLFDIDVQGYEIVRDKVPHSELASVFITTPSLSELRVRLQARGSNADTDIALRLQNAQEEMKRLGEYDYLIINDRLEQAYENFRSIYKAIRLETACRDINKLIEIWKI